jgi:flagellar biosynthesis/type III secretory pathway protein FliH
MEAPPLPRQWDNLLGGAPEQAQAAQPSGSAPDAAAVPPMFLEQMERMEKRLKHLEARLDTMESSAKEELERAAAAAAARILREELAAILAEGTA